MMGTVVRFDRFGNAISNVSFDFYRNFAKEGPSASRWAVLPSTELSESYYEGQYTCLVSSSGYLEFGLFRGDLALDKAIRKGDAVRIRRMGSRKEG